VAFRIQEDEEREPGAALLAQEIGILVAFDVRGDVAEQNCLFAELGKRGV
jgi:hypothetical protein